MTALSHPRAFPAIRALELLDSLEANLRAAIHSADAERIHDLRVAARRFTQALIIFESSFKGTKAIRNQLKTAMKRLGEVRDLDISLKFLHKVEPGEHAERAAKIIGKITIERAASEARLHRTLAALTRKRVLPKWRTKLKKVTLLKKVAFRAAGRSPVLDAAIRFFERGDKAYASKNSSLKRSSSKHSSKRLHRLRIAAKKLRYTLELGNTPRAKRANQFDALEQVQSDLGHIHDFDSTGELLSKYRGSKKLLKDASEKQQKRIQDFRERWKTEFGGKSNRARWMQRIGEFAESLGG